MRASLPPLSQQDVLDEALPHEIGSVQIDADHDARHEDDHDALDELILVGPLDLLELAPRLADEALEPAAGNVALADLGTRGRRTGGRLRRACPDGRAVVRAAVRTARAALRACLARHGLPRLPVRRMAAAPAAELLELDPVGRVPLVLHRLVVPPLALGARERDLVSDSGCHLSFPSMFRRMLTHRARAAAW